MIPWIRDSRHAQIEGLTYCTQYIPLGFSFLETRKLKSGASIPTNQLILAAANAVNNSRRALNKSDNCDSTSTKPITAKRANGNKLFSPCACILAPPTPTQTISSRKLFICCMKSAPRLSPDTSPATIPITNGADAKEELSEIAISSVSLAGLTK